MTQRKNLLAITQSILASMDSDEVSSINDTTEARMVVDIIEQSWNDITTQIEFPELWDHFELSPPLDMAKPTLLRLPDDIVKVDYIRYNRAGPGEPNDLIDILPLPREKFFDRQRQLVDKPNTYSYEYDSPRGTIVTWGYNNAWPQYYTTVNSRDVIFDNYDIAIGQTVVANRTHCYGQFYPEFVREDTWVPPISQRQFSLFFNEAKSQCFLELKQQENAKAEQRARRGWAHSQRKKRETNAAGIFDPIGVGLDSYGRRSKK